MKFRIVYGPMGRGNRYWIEKKALGLFWHHFHVLGREHTFDSAEAVREALRYFTECRAKMLSKKSVIYEQEIN